MKNDDAATSENERSLPDETGQSSETKQQSSGVVADRNEDPSGGLKTDLPLSYHRVRALFSYLCNTEFNDTDNL
ncbi:MAG: hypothetical protein ACHQM6_09620 [Candidatus Kapaibacterium sp.]